jgi:hypothetical protein
VVWTLRITGAAGDIVERDICLYTTTVPADVRSDEGEEFIIDRWQNSRLIVASPCSGHGAKFAPAIGAKLARLATELNPSPGLPLCYHSAMTKSTYDNIAKPVRKRSAKTGTLVGVRLQSEQIKAIDVWAAKQVPPVTRPEAIRGMIDAMLHILAKDPGEKPAKKARTR